jgi:integrase
VLTETKLKAAKPRQKPYKLFDERGLFVIVNPDGSRWWRFRYALNGKEKGISLGVYPDITLKRARDKRDDARKLVADGIDPSAKRQAEKVAAADTFEAIAREWLDKQPFAEATLEKAKWTFEELLFPHIGNRPVSQLTAPEVLEALRRLERRGKHETAHRTKQRVGQVLRYAIATGRAERDVTADLRGALTPVKTTNHAAIVDPVKIGELLRSIDGYSGFPATEAALKLAPLVFVRPGELRKARWEEFQLEGKQPEWRIPAERMKMKEQHIVPLSKQAVAILQWLRPITGPEGFVFPGLTDPNRPMSENAITVALRRMGYSGDEMTWHGFRSLASTSLNEQGHHPDLIELQLAHAERNKVRAAYNKAQRLNERCKMMQEWADYLDGLRAGPNIIPLRRPA